MQTFIYLYYRASIKLNPFFSTVVAATGYLLVALLIKQANISGLAPIMIATASILIFVRLFKPIENIKVKNKVDLNGKAIVVRAVLASSIILAITGVANSVGSVWAGLLSAFPVTLFPLIIIVHLTYDTKHVHAVIKNVPFGIPSLMIYSLTISVAYPLLGIYLGTVAAYLVATLYLIGYRIFSIKFTSQITT